MPDNPVKALDSQIASIGNDTVLAIEAGYSPIPTNLGVNSTTVRGLNYRLPQNKVTMPSKVCTQDIDFMNSYNDLNLNKRIKDLSLDPLMKRLIQEKNDILRAIEGWVASQANDGARQPLLAKSITSWVNKAIGYMRCGVMLIQKITTLINQMVTAVTSLINSITYMIISDLQAAKELQTMMSTMGKNLEKEGYKLVTIAAINALQDPLALLNEIGATQNELLQLKNQLNLKHLNGMLVSSINQFNAVINSFKQRCTSVQTNRAIVLNLQNSLTNLNLALTNVQNIDLSIPLNPGGVNPGALSDFSMTNAPNLFTTYNGLNATAKFQDWDSLINGLNSTSPGLWNTVFTSNEEGNLVFAGNSYGVFEVGLGFDTQNKCANSFIKVRLLINGGEWIVETSIIGSKLESDEVGQVEYATKYGVFTTVPAAPNPGDRLIPLFNEVIEAINSPVSYGATIDNPSGGTMLVPPVSTFPDQYILDDASLTKANAIISAAGKTWSTLDGPTWNAVSGVLLRWPTQNEINIQEANYSNNLQNLGLSPIIWINPYPIANPTSSHFTSSNLATDQSLTITPTGTSITLQYSMPYDTQLQTHLYGKKPYGGISIYTTSLSLEVFRGAKSLTTFPRLASTANDTVDNAHVVSFGLLADWGFAPISKL